MVHSALKIYFLIFSIFLFFPVVSYAINISPPTIEEMNKAVLEASSKTRVRSALLFGLLGQETGYGRNLGRTEDGWKTYCQNVSSQDCRNWVRFDCKETYEEARYLNDILKSLGIAKNSIKTSSTCALGFTQFEPKTWQLVTKSKPGKIYNPWNIYDSVLIAAYFLQDLGADSSEVLRQGSVLGAKDKIALQKYYCGSRFTRRECIDYAQNVEYKARISPEALLKRDLERQLEILEEERRKKASSMPGLAAVRCAEVSADDFGFGIMPDAEKASTVVTLLDNVNRDLLDVLKNFQRTGARELVSEIQDLAQRRKILLLEAFYRNPDRAVFLLLLDSDRNAVSQITGQCIEKEVLLEGTIEALHVDFEDGSGQSQYVLLINESESVILHPAFGLGIALESGVKVRVRGARIDNELIFNGTRSLNKAGDYFGGIDLVPAIDN